MIPLTGMTASQAAEKLRRFIRDSYSATQEFSGEEFLHLASLLEQGARQASELGEQLEFDRSAVADGVTAIKKTVDSRHWLTQGRGSYEWDDDRWRAEFAAAAKEILTALEPLAKIAANWKDCPQTAEQIAMSRMDLKAKAEQGARDTERLDWLFAGWKNVHISYSDMAGFAGWIVWFHTSPLCDPQPTPRAALDAALRREAPRE